MKRNVLGCLSFTLFLFLSVNGHAEHNPLSDPKASFRPVAPPNSQFDKDRAFAEIYLERNGEPNYREILRERQNDFLTQQVLKTFSDAVGGQPQWAIMYAEQFNTSPRLGGKGFTTDHRPSAHGFSELLGSLPGTEQDPFVNTIARKKTYFEDRMNALEQEKERDGGEFKGEDKKEKEVELNYVTLGYWASEEAEKIIREGAGYSAPEGPGEMVAFKTVFAEEFKEKLKGIQRFHELVEKAGNGDETARKQLIDEFDGALITYAATQSPLQAKKVIDAIGTGDLNTVTLYNRNGVPEKPITFGNTVAQNQTVINAWKKKYQDGDFSLKPPPPGKNKRTTVAGNTPGTGGATTPTATPNLSELAARAGATANARLGAAQTQANARVAAAQQQAAGAQGRAQLAFNDFLNRVRARFGLALGQGRALSAQAQAQAAQRAAQIQAALARQAQAQLFAQFGYPFRPPPPGGFSSNVDVPSNVETILSERCTSCHEPKDPGRIAEILRDEGENATMSGGPQFLDPQTGLTQDEFTDLKEWADTQS